MEVTDIIASWLSQAHVLTREPEVVKGRIKISEEDAQGFESGQSFVPVLKRLFSLSPQTERGSAISSEINSIKASHTAATKLYNWNMIIKALESFNIFVDSDMKALIIAGDRGIILEILKAVSQIEQRDIQNSRKRKKRSKMLGEGAILLDELDVNTELKDADNTLEFLILSFCQVFNITPKIAAGLLAQSGKILTQVLTKGLKGNIEPVIDWYVKISQTSEQLTELIIKERANGSIALVLGSIKSGLNGKDFNIVRKCCETLVVLNKKLTENEVNTWDWFVIDVLNLAFRAYDIYKEDVTVYILDLLLSFGKENLKDVFGQLIINNYPDTVQCFNVISSFWGYLVENTRAYSDIQTQGIIDYWVEFGLKQAEYEESSTHSTKVAAIGFLCDIWYKFSAYIEKHEDTANCILTIIKRACREKSRILKIICHGRLFQLLSLFFKLKNSYAPIIYKTLTFSLVEGYSNDRIREFILNNFLTILEEIPTLPLSILLEPLIKQASLSNKPRYNTSDFDFFVAVARHGKLALKDAIIIIDYLGKIYYNDTIFSNSAEIPLFLIIGKFINNKAVQEFILKFLKLGFKFIHSKLAPKFRGPVREGSKEEAEDKRWLSYYKKIVFGLIEKLINLSNEDLNNEIQSLLLISHLEIKGVTGGNMRGIKTLLNFLGDATAMIEEFEASQMVVDIIRNNSVMLTPVSASINSEIQKGTLSVASQGTRSRAMSDIERVRRMRLEKQNREKSQTDLRKATEERQKKKLKELIEQKKVALNIDGARGEAQVIINKDFILTEDIGLELIQEEIKEEQEIIWVVVKKFRRVFRGLFKHYSNSGYKKDKFSLRAPFETLLEKKSTISEGEISKMLREHGVSMNLLPIEGLKKVLAWYHQKIKQTDIDIENFPEVLYYIALYINSKGCFFCSRLPLGVCLMTLLDTFKDSGANILPRSLYFEPDFGVGDKEVLKMLNEKLASGSDIILPEGYVKVKEKDIKFSYEAPSFHKPSMRASIEILDSIFFSKFKVHLITPVVSVITQTYIKGVLNKPKLQNEDKQQFGVPANKAAYKSQPLPAYLNLTPGIKLEIANLSGMYQNQLILECGRLLDDLIHTIENKSFAVISRNPKPAGSISNKAIRQRTMQTEQEMLEKHKQEAIRQMRKKITELELAKIRSEKENRLKNEEELKKIQADEEEAKRRRENEQKMLQKVEINNKIKEYKMKKKEEEIKKIKQEHEVEQREKEKKKREREEFLRNAKKKIVESFSKK